MKGQLPECLNCVPGCRCAIYPTRPLVCRHFAAGGSACRELRLMSIGVRAQL